MSSSSSQSPLLQGNSSSSNYGGTAGESNLDVESSAANSSDGIENEYYFGVIPAGYITGDVKPSNEKVGVTFLLISSMIGSGILSQPYCFMKGGIFLVLCIYCVVGYGIYLCCHLLLTASEKVIVERDLDPKTFEYADLSYQALGETGRYITEVFITLANFFALVSYVIVIGVLSSQCLLTELTGDSPWEKTITRPSLDTTIIMVVLVIPPCMIRNFGHLTFVSQCSICLVMLAIIFVIGFGPLEDTYYWQTHDFGDVRDINFWDGENLSTVLGAIIFTLSFSTAIFPAYQSLDPRSLGTIREVCAYTILAGASLCTIMGLAGYLAFMETTEDNIIYNFTSDTFWSLVTVFKLAIVLHLCFYIPMEFVVMRQCVYTLLQWEAQEVSTEALISLTLILLGAALGTGVLLLETTEKAFGLVLAISGGICFSTLVFILPGIITLVLFWPKNNKELQVLTNETKLDIGLGLFFALFGTGILMFTVIDVIFIHPPDFGQ